MIDQVLGHRMPLGYVAMPHVRMGQRIVCLQEIGVIVLAVAVNPEVPDPFVFKCDNQNRSFRKWCFSP